jgi:CHAD domain-containing protein
VNPTDGGDGPTEDGHVSVPEAAAPTVVPTTVPLAATTAAVTGVADEESGPAPAVPVEVELKYDVDDPAALDAFLARPDVGGVPADAWHETAVQDRYVDTRDRALERAGYAARLRGRDGTTTLALKSLTPASGALHRREELEGAASEELDPAAWPASPARDLLVATVGSAPLEERFTIRQRRRVRELRGPAGVAELSADEVQVLREGLPLGSFAALEVELRDGSEELLVRLAAAIEATGVVRPSDRSKFEAARSLAEAADAQAAPKGRGAGSKGRASATEPAAGQANGGPGSNTHGLVVGRSPGVVADDPLPEAGRKVLRFHLARMLAAEAGTRSGEEVEDLHKMRVATRRMRAAWRVFGGGFRPARVRRSVAGLRTLAADLGAVRDLDVLIEGLEGYAKTIGEPAGAGLRPLVDAWREERERARTRLVRYLDSDAYRHFVDDQVTFVITDGMDAIPAAPADPRRVRDTAASRLWEAYQQVRAYDAILRWADLAAIHELRIAGKRLRYAIEFFREPLGPEAGMLVERVTAMQDHLGMLHDADVAAGLARAYLVRHSAHLAPAAVDAIGGYLREREREVTRLRRTLGPTWRRVTSVEFRRALGRVTARL